MNSYLRLLLGSIVLLSTTSCSQYGELSGNRELASESGRKYGFEVITLKSESMTIFSLLRSVPSQQTLIVFIEGDGAPWRTVRHPPIDPTPNRSVALALAFHTNGAVAYLARPCQYESRLAECPQRYWTSDRFTIDLIGVMSNSLDQLKNKAEASKLILIGYSGGGVIATLLAQRRKDIVKLVTVAAPLALDEWTRIMHLSAFPEGSDPISGPRLEMPSTHFGGGQDKVVPADIIEQFSLRHGGRFILKKAYDHYCCWEKLSTDELIRSEP